MENEMDLKEAKSKRQKTDGRFYIGDSRASECGRKGGMAKKATGSKIGRKYYYRGFEITWDSRKHAWRAKDGMRTLYSRDGVNATISQLRELLNNEPGFIETPTEEQNGA